MGKSSGYVIRGVVEGRERLPVLARVTGDSSKALLDRLDLRDGLACLDAGCGGGDVTLELARRVAPSGRVVGVDADPTTLEIAREEARQRGIANVELRVADASRASPTPDFDVVYARFLLTHLKAPADAVAAFHRSLRPGGVVAVEDIDFTGHFTHPDSPSQRRFEELYCELVRRRGGDPNIGPRLPSLLRGAGFTAIGVAVVQPVALVGEPKLLTPITMENIADAVLQEGLATRAEVDETIRGLYDFATDPETLSGAPRIVQAWGRRN